MKYVSLVAAVLTLLFMLAVPAYAAAPVDIPDWALKPAEDPDAVDDDTAPVTVMDPITVRDSAGNVIYQDDGAGTSETELLPDLYQLNEDTSLFLAKPFEEYTVTEGFLLLFLVLGFCLVVWKIVKGVL